MTVVSKVLIGPEYVGTAPELLYQAASVTTVIDKFTITNASANPVSVSVSIPLPGATGMLTTALIRIRTIAAGQTYLCPEIVGHVLENNMAIYAWAGVEDAIFIRASGREFSV